MTVPPWPYIPIIAWRNAKCRWMTLFTLKVIMLADLSRTNGFNWDVFISFSTYTFISIADFKNIENYDYYQAKYFAKQHCAVLPNLPIFDL